MRARFGLFLSAVLLAGCASGAPSPPPPSAPDVAPPADSAPAVAQPTTPPAAEPATTPTPPLTSAPDAWQLLDLGEDGVPGVGATRTYRELLADRSPARTVVVAVIDGGVDTAHVDLRSVLWNNADETAGNGIDDDGNGYADDVYGWNFIGGADGRNVGHETLEVTRLYATCRDGGTPPPQGLTCADIDRAYTERKAEVDGTLGQIEQIEAAYGFALPILRRATGEEELSQENVAAILTGGRDVQQARNLYLQLAAAGITPADIDEAKEAYVGLSQYGLDPDFETRSIVGDDYANGDERVYGNRDVMGPDASHGTHVAGIVGAVRGNDVGMDGIAEVQIMAVRAVPDGDERDKDVANAIRYAVDNGAQIINMSFGKGYSPRKPLVDAAIRYADEAGVLMIHAAGNDGEDLEVESNFPSRDYDDGGRAQNWIEVGAANWKVDSLAATFSNFGQTKVDVFAPGVDILSTVPGGGFERQDGTSMAAPVVSGVAALLMSYFPDLTAADVKRIILESSVKYGDDVVPQPGDGTPVPFGSLSVTGGVVNVYEAVRRALAIT